MTTDLRHLPRVSHRLLTVALVLALVAAACGGDDDATPDTTTTTASTTTTTTITTTSAAPSSTTSYADISVTVDDDAGAGEAVTAFYGWIGDPTLPPPDIPEGLIDHMAAAQVDGSETIQAQLHWAEVGDGRAGVVTADDDVVLLADEGDGWQVVGAWLPRFGLDPWFGDPLRYVLVIGTDARPGQDQQNFRADSIHILSSNISERGGGILGFPRDAYVEAPYGMDKYTHVNVYAGQDAMVDIAAELSGQPMEGYIVTGFTGFRQMINAFGGVWVDVPFGIDDWRAEALMSAGYQLLWGDKALGFSRTRRMAGGDFKRSFHQGVVILAGLNGVLERDMTAVPSLVAMLDEFTWTNLSIGDLVTLGAGALLLDPDQVGNAVLPGAVTSRGGASVVVLSASAEDLFRDLDDGILTPDE